MAQQSEVNVTTAIDPGDEERKKLASKISSLIGTDATSITFTVDPEIIAGIVIKTRNRAIDGSIRSRLMALRQEMLGRAKGEIYGG